MFVIAGLKSKSLGREVMCKCLNFWHTWLPRLALGCKERLKSSSDAASSGDSGFCAEERGGERGASLSLSPRTPPPPSPPSRRIKEPGLALLPVAGDAARNAGVAAGCRDGSAPPSVSSSSFVAHGSRYLDWRIHGMIIPPPPPSPSPPPLPPPPEPSRKSSGV